MALTNVNDEIETFTPSDYDLCIQGLMIPARGNPESHVRVFLESVLGDEELAEKIEYSGHEIAQRGSERELRLRLLFDGEREVTQDRKRLGYFVCCSLFHPENDGVLLSMSKYGIMGFSAGDNEFGRIWNLVAVEKTLKRGHDIFQQTFPQPSRDRWPMWSNVAAMAVLSGFETCFNLSPDTFGADQERFSTNEKAEQARSEQMQPLTKSIGSSIVVKLREWARIRNSTRNVTAVKAELGNSLSAFTGQTQQLFNKINSLTEERQDTLSKADQVEICGDLYRLVETCGMVWSASEALMDTYLRLASENLREGVASGITSLVAGIKAVQVAQSAIWHTNAGAALVTNVAKENLVVQLGRTMGVVTSQTPMQVARAGQAAHAAAAGKLVAISAASGIAAAISAGVAIHSTIKAFQNVKKAEICRIIHLHAFNVGTIAWQTRTTLTWVAILNQKPVFVGEAKSAWEAYLRQRYGNSLRDELFQPQFVKAELRQCATDLRVGHCKLEEKLRGYDIGNLLT